MSWTLADIRTQVKSLVGDSSMANATLDALINDFYRNDFCQELDLRRFDQAWTQQATATDSGTYTVSEDVIKIASPVFANGEDAELVVFLDGPSFWRTYPDQEDVKTAPSLAIGTSDAAAVANSAFRYVLDSWTRSKAAAETSLSGDAVPQSTYGAWQLEIDADGDFTVQAASDNATGYGTAALAVNGLPQRGANRIIVGYVTAINTSGAFTPGTTELSASGVTDTYTDGNPGLRGLPESILLDRSAATVVVRPKCNDDYTLKSMASLQRPTALSEATDTPHDEAWGRALALGAAIKHLTGQPGDTAHIHELTYGSNPGEPTPGCLRYELNRASRKQLLQLSDRGVERAW